MLNADIKEFNFTSEADGLNISAVIAVPSGEKSGIVHIIHGMCEYKERYFDFMDYLASEGFISVIADNRGHGKSICSEDDLGFMYKDGADNLVADVAQLNRIVRGAYPGMPVFMIGHSMGSLAARCFLKEHDRDVDGVIVLGCPCFSAFSSFARTVNSSISQKLGSRYRSEKISGIVENMFNRQFSSENLAHSWICSDPSVVANFNADPMCNFIYTLNGYESLLILFKDTYTKRGWKVENPHLPLRFISGKDDPCMLSEAKFMKALGLLEKIGYENISHRIFDGMRHEVLNEKNNLVVYKDIAKTLFSWLDELR